MQRSHCLTLGLTSLLVVTGIPIDVQAHTSTPSSSASLTPASPLLIAQRKKRRWRFRVRPSRYRAGGYPHVRSCPKGSAIAFVPPPQPEEKIDNRDAPVELTLSSHPTFWVYVTDLPPDSQVRFVLQREIPALAVPSLEYEAYRVEFALKQPAGKAAETLTGLVGVRLPKNETALKVGERYTWTMQIECGEDNVDVLVGSLLQRISPDQIKPTGDSNPAVLLRELAKAPERDRPGIYAELSLWHDAVTALIDLRQKQPKNAELAKEWRDLMIDANMADFVNVPILGIY